MALDDAESLRRFISQMKGQPTQHDQPDQPDQLANGHGPSADTVADGKHISEGNKSQGEDAKTAPHARVAAQNHSDQTSPDPHPKPSPHISGLTAPYNTPKTAASSPRLPAVNNHNQDVADAFSDYVNNMHGRPLSESMWAPPSARYKPSMPRGAPATKVLTSINAIEPNPAMNDTFHRMSFKAADPNHKVGENLIGDHVTQSLFSKTSPSSVNKSSLLVEKIPEDKVDDVLVKPEAASDEAFESPAHTDVVEKENDAHSTSKAYLPPHLRTVRDSSQKSDFSTRVPAQKADEFSPSKSSPTAPSSDQNPAPSESTVEAETTAPCPGGLSPDVTSKAADSNTVKDAVRAATTGVEPQVITGPVGAKPLKGASESENLEHKTFFNAWPELEERSKPGVCSHSSSLPVVANPQAAAKVRKVIIKDLPRGSTATFVASLVYGGPIEEIHVRSSAAGDLSAAIRFMDAGDCMRFYEETSNGLVYQKDAKGRELVLFVELSPDVDVVGGLLQGWIVSGVTRCVRAVGVEAEWDMDGLVKIAERKNRKVEKIVDGQNPGGARSVVFRFCKVEDAVQFRAALSRDEEWEHCNIHYAADPCAIAVGVHFDG
ncbi:hypothetical protein HO133_010115 [Letharia lupina]|uniref:RRM domain-containing protein n=1 Tax=Letharia lupina TaxID=560253 RepID=A0A8H6CKK4_9LECA|nr:uncharacterized protein HO133_010115 [Letharia lupina]KAF6224921.1 hypothetical protein HO133_010115 [Letharia lupina]